jgi:predicted enzyme related to lactoylglutathione lyase
MGDPVVQWQIVTRDPQRATDFYSSLFGWSVDGNNALGYRRIDTGSSQGIGGAVWPRGDEGHDLVQLFIEVDDVDASAARAVALGGRVLVPKQELPDGDALALILDPGGLSFGLYAPAARRSSSSKSR